MGVLFINEGDEEVESFQCSYGYVQNLRRSVINATLLYIENQIKVIEDLLLKDNEGVHSSDDLEELQDFENIKNTISQWRFDSNGQSVNIGGIELIMTIAYHRIPKDGPPQLLAKHGLAGLYWFVNFSDCDGVYSSGQVYDIWKLFEKILPNNEHLREELGYDDNDLLKVFETAIKDPQNIRTVILS